MMLEIHGLTASIGDKPILKGIDLTVPAGEIHAIMAPTGPGKPPRGRGESEPDAVQFLKLARGELKRLAMADDMLKRNVNVGFSGGEKKRNEVLQMALLKPRFAVLDETDSGLDIDALKIVAEGVNALRGPAFSALVITHHQRLLDHLVPNRVHVLAHGRIVRSGGPELAKELEKSGYAGLIAEAA